MNRILHTQEAPLIAAATIFFAVSLATAAFGQDNQLIQRESESGAQAGFSESDPMYQWGQWRGPLQTGVAPKADPPIHWSEGKNILWKTQLPGLGHSTPIVWNDRIYLTSAREIGEKFKARPDTAPGAHDNKLVDSRFEFLAIAIDRKTGKIVWQKSLNNAIPHEGAHNSASLASASAVTDGKHIYFHFGSYGLFCLDRDGNTKWRIDLGIMHSKHGHGEGSSPALADGTLVVNWDQEDQSFVAAFDAKDGSVIWKVDRPEPTSWSSPIIIDQGGRKQVVVAGTGRIRGYDLKTGEVIWSCGGLSHNVCATPVYADGMLYAGSSYETRMIMGINVDGATGDITSSDRVVWQSTLRPPYVPSLLLVGDALYFLRHYQGILTRLDAKTGEQPTGPFRLERMQEIYASPVSAAGRIYVTDRSGGTIVISADKEHQQLALNRLDDRFSASAALVDRETYLRGEKNLYCIMEEK